MSAATRYLRSWALATLLLLLAVALINLLVDPYDLFRAIGRDGFNRIKSQAGQRALTFKRTNVERVQPNALILGNSRAEIGFDPDSPSWPKNLRPVFNLAIPGSGPTLALEEFRRVEKMASPRLVLVGLDFLDFRVDPSSRYGGVPPRADQDDKLQRIRDRVSALFTIDAFIDSLATIKAQQESYPTELTSAGFNPMRDYVGIARREGYYAMFRQRNQENARNYLRGWKSVYQAGGRPSPAFDATAEIVSTAQKKSVAVRLIIYPYHAQTLVLFHQAGLWPAFEDWKRELAKLLVAAPIGSDVEIWDFSSFLPYADEKVPPPGDTTSKLEWYWEAGHFTKALGDVALARVFDERAAADQWGRRLLPQDVEENVRELRAARDEYERAHPSEVAELAQLIAAATAR